LLTVRELIRFKVTWLEAPSSRPQGWIVGTQSQIPTAVYLLLDQAAGKTTGTGKDADLDLNTTAK